MQNYFTTGQFAKMHGLNKRTLQYYADIGLFCPEIVKENNYRYYTHQQSTALEVILILRELGVSLEEIKKYIVSRSPENLMAVLRHKRVEIAEQMKNLDRMDYIITNKMQELEQYKDIDVDFIGVVDMPAEYYIHDKLVGNIEEEAAINTIYHMANYRHTSKLFSGYSWGTMVSAKELLKGNYTAYAYIFSKLDNRLKNQHTHLKQKGKYLVAYSKGDYNLLPKTYERMLAFAALHGIEITGYSYEESVIDEFSVADINDVVTKVSIAVLKSSNN